MFNSRCVHTEIYQQLAAITISQDNQSFKYYLLDDGLLSGKGGYSSVNEAIAAARIELDELKKWNTGYKAFQDGVDSGRHNDSRRGTASERFSSVSVDALAGGNERVWERNNLLCFVVCG